MTYEEEKSRIEKLKKPAKYIGIGLGVFILLFNMVGTVRAGYIGVRTRFSAVTGNVARPGPYMKVPFIESVKKINIQTQKEQVDATAASKDLQNVNATVALNYSLNPDAAVHLYESLGLDYKVRVIDPFIQESVKAATANFTAEELITKREEVSQEIKSHLADKLIEVGIRTEAMSIVDFRFSASFDQAIEAKVTAEQNALAAKNKLEQTKYEAQQAIEEAQGKARALQIEGQALASNPQVKELRAIEKWNGVLPQVTSGAVPFINIQ